MPYQLANPVSLGQINDAIKNGIVSWHKGAELDEQMTLGVRSLFWEKSASEYTEEHSGMITESGFALGSGDGEDYNLVSDIQGDTLNMTQRKITARRKITEDMIRWNKYPEIDRRLRLIGGKLWRRYALDLSHRFTFSGSTAYTSSEGDSFSVVDGAGAAMVADTRTLNSGDTIDNKLLARLSESALEDAEDLGAAFLDHSGQLVFMTFSHLATGPHASTRHLAERLTGQTAQVGTDLNDMNPYRGKLTHVVIPYLATTAAGAVDSTKSRYWFLLNLQYKDNLIASVGDFPKLDAPTVDPDNNSIQFKGAMRYDIGLLDSNWLVGSLAS